MKVSDDFIADLRYLKVRYEWNADDVDEIKAALKGAPSLVHYFTVLAAAHRAGYSQDAANGFVRLQKWCSDRGLPEPFSSEFDPELLDAAPMPEMRVR